MTKAKKKKIAIGVISGFLALVLVIAFILCFPLFGKKHVQVWAASDEFDINSIQTVEKNPDEEFKILQLTDLQLWANLCHNVKR